MNHHKKIWGASAFAALSLVFVFATGGFTDKPTLRSQVATLEHEVAQLRETQAAAVTTTKQVRQVSALGACDAQYQNCSKGCGGDTLETCLLACFEQYKNCQTGSGQTVFANPGFLVPVGRLTRNNVLADVQKIQSVLITKGYLKGTADGKFGLGTEAAVKAFQKASGLSETGIVDTVTSAKLFTETQLPADGKGTLSSFLLKNPNGIEGPTTVWMRLSDGRLWNCDLLADKTYTCHYWVPTTGSAGSTTTQ